MVERVNALERETGSQWKKIDLQDERINKMITRMNVAMGGIAVSCILLAVNVILRLKGGP